MVVVVCFCCFFVVVVCFVCWCCLGVCFCFVLFVLVYFVIRGEGEGGVFFFFFSFFVVPTKLY